jgi:hypothetical protein
MQTDFYSGPALSACTLTLATVWADVWGHILLERFSVEEEEEEEDEG